MDLIIKPINIKNLIEMYNLKCYLYNNIIIKFNCDENWYYKMKNNNLLTYKINYMEFLPNEMIELIIGFSENLKCKYVCKRWNDIVKINCYYNKKWPEKYYPTQYSTNKFYGYENNIFLGLNYNMLLIFNNMAGYSC